MGWWEMLDLASLIQFFQATLVPVVMISGIGLVTLIIQTRYSRVVDSARRLNQERLRLINSLAQMEGSGSAKQRVLTGYRLDDIETQIGLLVKRGRILKYSLFSMFTAVFVFIFTSFLIMLQMLAQLTFLVEVIAMSFLVGMFLLLAGGLFVVHDIIYSYDAVLIDLRTRTR